MVAELETGPWCDRLDGVDAIIHIAGEPIAGRRWNARQKQLIRDSRVESTRTIVEAISKARTKPKTLVTASGIDYYAFASHKHDFDDDEVTESDPSADTFLGRLCRDWEHEAQAAEAHGVRVVSMRTGLVLGKHGGALEKMRRPFELFAGGKIGSGRQWLSWIHVDDVVAAYIAAASDDRYRGAFNLVADSTRNAEFSRARQGARQTDVVTRALVRDQSCSRSGIRGVAARRSPGRSDELRALGFQWRHPTLADALAAAV